MQNLLRLLLSAVRYLPLETKWKKIIALLLVLAGISYYLYTGDHENAETLIESLTEQEEISSNGGSSSQSELLPAN